jgi:hypothetical protein
MAKRDILKEAIADAKAVKEVAIANAKAALEEAFTPQLKSMLSAKLEEMEKEDELEEMSDPIMRHGMEGDTDPEELETEYMRDDMMEGDDMSYEDDLDEEFSIEEILAELEKDTLNEQEEEEEEEVEVETEEEEETEDDDESDAKELDDMTDEELKDFIEDVISDMVAAGELEAGESFESEEGAMDVDMEMDVEDDEELDIEVEDDEEVEVMEAAINRKNRTIEKTNGALREAKAKIRTLEKANKILSESNKEIQLLNAKLLYTNKIFKAKNLTESEKVKVLGAFDNATTINESKLVFETLSEGLKSKKSHKQPIKESLGRASRATGNFNRTKKPIIEANPMVDRFQKLAGLK